MRALVVGLLVGASTMAGALWLSSGLLAWLPEPVRDTALLGLVLVALWRDLGLVTFPLPERTTLVPRQIFEAGLGRGAFRFGIELGVGFRTRLPTSVPYVLAAALLLGLPDLPEAALIAISFAAGRSVAPVHRLVTKAGEQWDASLAAAGRSLAVSSSLVAAVALAWAVVR
jgi:hypothetical protein